MKKIMKHAAIGYLICAAFTAQAMKRSHNSIEEPNAKRIKLLTDLTQTELHNQTIINFLNNSAFLLNNSRKNINLTSDELKKCSFQSADDTLTQENLTTLLSNYESLLDGIEKSLKRSSDLLAKFLEKTQTPSSFKEDFTFIDVEND